MARKSETRTIDGLDFTVTQLDPRRAQRLMVRVLSLVAGPVGKAIGSIMAGKGLSLADAAVDFAKVGEALPSLFERLTADELEAIQKELLATALVRKDGHEQMFWPAFDSVIENPLTPIKLTLFAFEVNFGNFVGALTARVQAAAAAGASRFNSPSTSLATGPSGASS